ncbi:MAG: PhoU domain-containing protein, partial [Tolumonas sp.]|nr:PhoU domain-containing protein [Tolumonas sp.]
MEVNKHISGQFNNELETIRSSVLAMGGMVEQQLSDALEAIHSQDVELARSIVETD